MKRIFLRLSLIPLIAAGLTACSKFSDTELIMQRMADVPTIETFAPQRVTTNAAEVGGRILSTGGGNITESGIHIYASGSPSFPGQTPPPRFSEKRLSQLTAEGIFAVRLRGLRSNTTYHYRAFATNEAGTAYGEMEILVTSFSIISDLEGNQYQTIRIGEQTWMRENLRSGKYTDGTSIKGNCDPPEGYAFGKYYSWQAIKGIDPNITVDKDICPDGWRVPGDEDWKELLKYTGVPADQLDKTGPIGTDQAIKLKDSGSDYWDSDLNLNSTGFSALPAGVCAGAEVTPSLQAAFWTSTPYVYYGFQNGSDKIIRGNDPQNDSGYSIRCIQN
jgi:uncharacterized protein (TIGR02145 family)